MYVVFKTKFFIFFGDLKGVYRNMRASIYVLIGTIMFLYLKKGAIWDSNPWPNVSLVRVRKYCRVISVCVQFLFGN